MNSSVFDPKRYERNGGKIIDVEPYQLTPVKREKKKRKHKIDKKFVAIILLLIAVTAVSQTSILLPIAGFFVGYFLGNKEKRRKI